MSQNLKSRKWTLVELVGNNIDLDKAFKLETTEINASSLKENQFLVRTLYLSNDPAQRTWISEEIPEERHYIKPVEPGEVMRAGGIAEVIESKNAEYKKGDLVFHYTGWEEYKILDTAMARVPKHIEPAQFLALQLTALTAYFGLLRVGRATSSHKTVVVSSAAGATGSIVAQIAKNVLGCKTVIGIAGSAEKCKILEEHGIDVALNYKDKDFEEQFAKATPNYIDLYFDNVGSRILDMSLHRMALNGRIITCGAISSYDSNGGTAISAKSYVNVIMQRVTIQGFVVVDFQEEFADASKELYKWTEEGKLKPLDTVWEAKFEDIPKGMEKLTKGDNVGKLVTKIVY